MEDEGKNDSSLQFTLSLTFQPFSLLSSLHKVLLVAGEGKTILGFLHHEGIMHNFGPSWVAPCLQLLSPNAEMLLWGYGGDL